MTMTDSKDALIKSLAKVEAGEWDWRIDWADWDCSSMPSINDCKNAYNGSLDAAKALHEAVLPEWHWNVSKDGVARIVIPSRLRTIPTVGRSDSSPARAWLIAILKALIAGEDTNANDKGE
jgi:hypothetical protein